jgi:hypothetical protein
VGDNVRSAELSVLLFAIRDVPLATHEKPGKVRDRRRRSNGIA